MAKCFIRFDSAFMRVEVYTDRTKVPEEYWGSETFEVDIKASKLKYIQEIQFKHDRLQAFLMDVCKDQADNGPNPNRRYY